MATVSLIQQRTKEIHLRNEIKKMGQLQMKSNFNFSVKFAPDKKHCVAAIYQSFEDKSEENAFQASVVLEGIFNCDGVNGPEDQKLVHVQAYDALFPYLQSAVGQLFATTGIPGFMVKKMALDPERVVLGQAKKPGQEQKPPITLPIV